MSVCAAMFWKRMWPSESTLCERFLLRGEQFADARLAEREQVGELRFGERGLLAGALQFDEFAGGIHHQIHVHRRRHVLGVAQIQQRPAV